MRANCREAKMSRDLL